MHVVDNEAFSRGLCPRRCCVLEDGKGLLGHICVQLFEKSPIPSANPEFHAYVTNFYVVPEIRGRGFGKNC